MNVPRKCNKCHRFKCTCVPKSNAPKRVKFTISQPTDVHSSNGFVPRPTATNGRPYKLCIQLFTGESAKKKEGMRTMKEIGQNITNSKKSDVDCGDESDEELEAHRPKIKRARMKDNDVDSSDDSDQSIEANMEDDSEDVQNEGRTDSVGAVSENSMTEFAGHPLDECICGACDLTEFEKRKDKGLRCTRCGVTKVGIDGKVNRRMFKNLTENPVCEACWWYKDRNEHPRPICVKVREILQLSRIRETKQEKKGGFQADRSKIKKARVKYTAADSGDHSNQAIEANMEDDSDNVQNEGRADSVGAVSKNSMTEFAGHPLDTCICGACDLTEFEKRKDKGLRCTRCGVTKVGIDGKVNRRMFKDLTENPVCRACWWYKDRNEHPRPICAKVRDNLRLSRERETKQEKWDIWHVHRLNIKKPVVKYTAADSSDDSNEPIEANMEDDSDTQYEIPMNREVEEANEQMREHREGQMNEHVIGIEEHEDTDRTGAEVVYDVPNEVPMMNNEIEGQVKNEVEEEQEEQMEPDAIPVLSMPVFILESDGYVFCGRYHKMSHFLYTIGQLRTNLPENLKLEDEKHNILEREFIWLPFWDADYRKRLADTTSLTVEKVNKWHAKRTRLEMRGAYHSQSAEEKNLQVEAFFRGMIPDPLANRLKFIE